MKVHSNHQCGEMTIVLFSFVVLVKAVYRYTLRSVIYLEERTENVSLTICDQNHVSQLLLQVHSDTCSSALNTEEIFRIRF